MLDGRTVVEEPTWGVSLIRLGVVVEGQTEAEFVGRVFPYVQKHEFEALLFTDVAAFSAINAPSDAIDKLRAARSGFATPEDIDDDPATAPSKRIAAVVPRYHKVRDGANVAAAIGLPAMRAACPRFNAWLTRLESLVASRQ